MAEGERELTTGLLSKDASFRLIVSGQVGVKEIERPIRKLELDKKSWPSRRATRPPTEVASHLRGARSPRLSGAIAGIRRLRAS